MLTLTACSTATHSLRLREVVLYQSGIAYAERSGVASPEGVRLRVAAHELDDVLTTLTVVDRGEGQGSEGEGPAPAVVLPAGDGEGARELVVRLGGEARDVSVSYAVPTSAWRPSYRLVLPDERGSDEALLQAWAVVDNTSAEDWQDVELTLATASPLSFAVDLRTPRLVARPNVTGHVPPPVALGVVRGETSRRLDDGDGVAAGDDLCPDVPEDLDGFEDGDGCPEPDNDADGVLDVDDLCPDEGETFNGVGDEDGCPDRGRVVISDARIQILERLYFEAQSAVLGERTGPVLDAIASTLGAHANIRDVEIEGHADTRESQAWSLSAERAAAVRAALVGRGVEASRLTIRAFGASRPLTVSATESPVAENRRSEFRIAAPEPDESTSVASRPRGVRAEGLRRALRRTPPPQLASGGTRYTVGRQVSIPAGTSALVAILNQRLAGEDILLFRPDANSPASREHPFRAGRLANESDQDLVPGPIALFAHGEFVGQGLLSRLHAGERAFVPYAVDESSRVAVDVATDEEPARVLSMQGGVLVLENTRTRRTRYRIEVGQRAPGRIFVRHERAPDYEPRDLPPGTERSEDALLLPIPIEGGHQSVLEVEERRPVTSHVDLAQDLATDVRRYLEGDALPEAVADSLRRLLDDRDALRQVQQESRLLRRQLTETAQRNGELRLDVQALDGSGAAVASTRRRLTRHLETSVAHAEELGAQLATLRAQQLEATAHLRDAARQFVIEERQ